MNGILILCYTQFVVLNCIDFCLLLFDSIPDIVKRSFHHILPLLKLMAILRCSLTIPLFSSYS
ncbi:hypothetical protein DERF_006576 [Dermatophagoides farinae]|uniref:Uncharacterized protein n=1 Tax=Dermatophagoides farinae TaxID=6954 RepID=A0A922L2Q9_DERFA|nr:hypothetical protein DERF_006576 [Dermatophagoides farinae]